MATPTPTPAPAPITLPQTGFVRRHVVLAVSSYSKSTLYRKMSENKFPKPVKLGGERTVAWRVEEVRAWIEAQQPEVSK